LHIGGPELVYDTVQTQTLGAQNIQVEITPLPRNRARVAYTITAVPNGTTGISFKATY
jgi:hypothetical protein